MRQDILTLIEAAPAQRSDEWYKVRLGCFNGSGVGALMKRGRKKDEEFGTAATAYIRKVAGERCVNSFFLEIPELFGDFLEGYVTRPTSAMVWGNEHEHDALKAYEEVSGNKVTRCGSIAHDVMVYFRDSPDGLLLQADGVVEVKCPTLGTHCDYVWDIASADDLLAVKPEYYWQCISHMAVTGAAFCDWVSYRQDHIKPIHVVRIKRDDDVINSLLERVEHAEIIARALTAKASGTVS